MTEQKKHIFVTGANGQLGQEISHLSGRFPQYQFLFFSHQELDISDSIALNKAISPKSDDIIINAGAYTQVDLAEKENELADKANHIGPKNLSEVSVKTGCLLLHISTDYVFSGESPLPYNEEDNTNPLSVYGQTKLLGETKILNSGARAIIFRTSWVYSTFGNNFVKTMLRLAEERDTLSVVFEQVGSPTYARDLAEMLLGVVTKISQSLKLPQVYHYSNEGVTSWYDFAKAIMALGGKQCEVFPIEIKDYPLPAKRPVNSTLNKGKFKKDFGIVIPHWYASLKKCFREMNN